MTRLESSAWPLASGTGCVFVLAIVLDRLPWQAAFAAVAAAVLIWAWQTPVIGGAALGGIAWLCVTGFDVHRLGDITVTGSDDAIRVTVLVAGGVLAAVVHLGVDAWRRYERADPVWVAFHATGPGLEAEPSQIPVAGATTTLPLTSDKGTTDG